MSVCLRRAVAGGRGADPVASACQRACGSESRFLYFALSTTAIAASDCLIVFSFPVFF